jgi:hypothetical protein
MVRLQEKIRAECMDHCLVISNTFALPGWQPFRRIHVGGWWDTQVYAYLAGDKRGEVNPS